MYSKDDATLVHKNGVPDVGAVLVYLGSELKGGGLRSVIRLFPSTNSP